MDQKKRQKILLIVLAVVIVIAALFALSTLSEKFAKEEYQAREAAVPLMSTEEKKLKEVKLELEVLDNELFQALKSHGILPVAPGETGKENPFQSSF